MLTTVRLVTRGRWSEVAVVAMGQDVFVRPFRENFGSNNKLNFFNAQNCILYINLWYQIFRNFYVEITVHGFIIHFVNNYSAVWFYFKFDV
jgi:hypothetical protein